MTIQDQINDTKKSLVINRKNIMKRAWYLFNKGEFKTFGTSLSYVWSEVKTFRSEKKKRLNELEYSLLISIREAWAVQPHPEFWMKRSHNLN